ncbi:cytochrome P450 [Immersiella caudata]|uniref:Cytochrome P450 n=1 Tax=Immersiella caudata TaxID=314043 RepID=A0AA40BZ81_9PEZI|nr:cytochrome P450 [Immersiella caudata]
MDNLTTPQNPNPEHHFLIPQPHIPHKSGISVASYIFIFFIVLATQKTWSTLFQSKTSPTSKTQPAQHAKPVWYPHKDPIIGLDLFYIFVQAIVNRRYLSSVANVLRRNGATLTYLFVGRRAIVTIDTENIKTILSERFHDFGLGDIRTSGMRPLLGGGIFNSDGSTWKHHRATLRPFVSRAGPQELSVVEKHVQNLIKSIPHDGATTDLQSSFSFFTTDVATDLFLGTSTNLLLSASDGPEAQEFAAAFDYAQRAASGIDIFDIKNLPWKLLFGARHLTKCIRKIHVFIDKVLDEAIESSKLAQYDHEQKAFLPALLDNGRSREDVKYDILNVTLAGKDTMSSFLSSIWYVLSKRPDIINKIRKEISILNGRPPTREDITGFRYLHMVLQEVLRLYPPVAVNQRTAEVDTVLPHGGGEGGKEPIFVARGTSVGFSIYALHRLPEFFGEDVDVFRPERWMEINPGWAFMPFHAGPRRCLGQQLAMLWAKYCTVRLIQHFGQIEDRNEKPWEERIGLNVTSMHGVQVGLRA